MRMEGKVSIITGGGRGIGKDIAKKFAEEGSIVVLAARSKGEIDETLEEIAKKGGHGLSIQTDVSKLEDVKKLAAKVIENYSKIDVLVNNAGVIKPIKPIHEVDVEEWEHNLRINLFGTFYCIKTISPYMISKNYGKIINLSGGGAFKSMPNFSAYGASKSAIIRLTETVAAELRNYNITINAIAPGPIKTKMTYDTMESGDVGGIESIRAREIIEKGDVGIDKVTELAVFLASDESKGLSGKTISAKWDDIAYIKNNISVIQNSDKYTMKRMV
jgi:NAD(P)-dependent dehydrogenase (short-subunit alcohol dehydrogenase family)